MRERILILKQQPGQVDFEFVLQRRIETTPFIRT
jgi:hypothetical protein